MKEMLIDKNWLLVLFFAVMVVVFAKSWDSERTKRVELEAENKRITSIMEGVVKASIESQHTMAGCYYYQAEICFLIAEYYGLPVSLPAVPPKYTIDSFAIENGDSTWWYTIDSSEVTDTDSASI